MKRHITAAFLSVLFVLVVALFVATLIPSTASYATKELPVVEEIERISVSADQGAPAFLLYKYEHGLKEDHFIDENFDGRVNEVVFDYRSDRPQKITECNEKEQKKYKEVMLKYKIAHPSEPLPELEQLLAREKSVQ